MNKLINYSPLALASRTLIVIGIVVAIQWSPIGIAIAAVGLHLEIRRLLKK